MKDESVALGPREQQIADLLLQGCDNDEIARQLKMARRTVKAHFNRLFMRFGITNGIKRVKLATLLYRRQLCSEANATGNASPVKESNESLNLLPRDSRTERLQTQSEPQSMSSRTTYESSTTSSDFGTESNLPCGTKPEDSRVPPTPEVLETWEHSILDLVDSSFRRERVLEH
jgi:Bacterial regulatory proteins, luxR family